MSSSCVRKPVEHCQPGAAASKCVTGGAKQELIGVRVAAQYECLAVVMRYTTAPWCWPLYVTVVHQ